MTSTQHEPLHVLVVDDDQHLLRTLTDILRQRGYHPRTASTGREGLSVAAADTPPAIALIDLKLPDMDGMEVVSRLRELSQETEVVILTGNASIESAVGALRQHTHDYLIKPVSPEKLLLTLHRAGDRWLRRKAEEALRQSEERFRRLIESIVDVVFLIDADLRVSYVSPSVTRVLGLEPDAVLGRSVLDLFQAPADSPRSVAEALEQAITGTPIEVVSRHRDGRLRVLQGSVNDLREHPGLRGMVLTARDVTEQKQLEQQAMQAHRLDSIGRLAGGIAHDFNNLLCVILGSIELAKEEPSISPGLRTRLEEMRTAGERGATLTRQLLQFARQQPSEARTLDLRTVVDDLLPMLRRLIDESVDLVIDTGTEPAPVHAAPSQLEQILLNLAINARDAMPGGGQLKISIRLVDLEGDLARRHEHIGPGRYVLLVVEDSGVGMTEDVRAHALEPFFTTKELGRGTGLGLSICYGIVREAGGSLALTSAPGMGTRIEVLLPVIAAPREVRPVGQRVEALPKGRETILLVEDDAEVSAVVVAMLERLGYRVLTASDGREALERLAKVVPPVDLVVTDVVMPVMSGPEMVQALRAKEPDAKVLFVSGYPNPALCDGAELNGRLLGKPFTAEGLAHAVRAVLDGE